MLTKEIKLININQNHNNMLPFSFIAEDGYAGTDSNLNFEIEVVSSEYLKHSKIINRDNSYLMDNVADKNTYVSQSQRALNVHQSIFSVDIIGKDKNGISKIRTHVEPYKYEFEDARGKVFMIPKFTWDNTTEEDVEPFDKTMWVGTYLNKLNRVEYDNEAGSIDETTALENPVYKVIFGDGNDRMFVSTSDHLYKYVVGYYKDDYEFEQVYEAENPNRTLMSLYHNGFIWGVSSYLGKVFKMNENTFETIDEYDGMDSPFKIVYSKYHDSYFIAGSYFVWQIKNNVVKPIYKINDYKIADIDVSEDGKLCMVLNGFEDSYMRILDDDLFTMILNEKESGPVFKYCCYCGKGKFYAISELYRATGRLSYSSIHYVFDRSLQKFYTDEFLQTTTTTTPIGTTSKAVEVTSPIGETLKFGDSHEIKWISSKALSDNVKIELYKGSNWYSTITESTPNSGIYLWNIPSQIDEGSNYKIKVTWLAVSSDSDNWDLGGSFSIFETVPTTTTTTTTERITEESIGISFDSLNEQIVIVLKNGMYMIFDLNENKVYGLNNTNVQRPSCFNVNNTDVKVLDRQYQVRVFVGSEKHLNDRWDSGVIETDLTAMYYGGGNNLVPGKQYYAHIQTYSKKLGWSELQIKEFTMAK